MKKIKISPCPFCGGNANLKYRDGFDYGSRIFWVQCDSCGSKTRTAYIGMADKKPAADVVALWNGRVKP